MFKQHCQPAFGFETFRQEGNKFYYRHSLRYFKQNGIRYVWYTESVLNHNPTKKDVEKLELFEINRAKKYIISCINNEYKKSKGIIIDNKRVWLNSEQRSSLMNVINTDIDNGEEMIEIVIGNEKRNMTLYNVKTIITTIENYSKLNFIKKFDMINEVNSLTSLQDIVDYEEKITFNLPSILYFYEKPPKIC